MTAVPRADVPDGGDPSTAVLPVGVDAVALVGWMRERVPAVAPPLTFARIGDGRSNLTYRVEDAEGRAWVLRRPPAGPRLASAHDVAREHRLMRALHGSAVPVPAPLGLCEDDAVADAPLCLMELVPGRVVATADAGAALDPAVRRAAGASVAATLAALHDVDVDAVGLGELGRRDAYAERQLRRWRRQWEASRTRAVPALDRVHEVLSAHVPGQTAVAVVHGDYKLENVLLDGAGTVTAVLDWELCTLGDPLADLGMLLTYWREDGDGFPRGTGMGDATSVPGFPVRDEIVAAYAAASGRDLAALPFFRALSAWKLAVIYAGVVQRYRARPDDANADPDRFEPVIDALAAEAEELASGLGRRRSLSGR